MAQGAQGDTGGTGGHGRARAATGGYGLARAGKEGQWGAVMEGEEAEEGKEEKWRVRATCKHVGR